MREVDADVLCLQEVEVVGTLKHFRTECLGGRARYPYVAGIDGNDPRLIDVAVLSRLPITHVRSYQHLLERGDDTVFSRDCLEVDITVEDGKTLTVFVQHFKSMIGSRENTTPPRARSPGGQTDRHRPLRRPARRARVRHSRDCNDYREDDDQGRSGILDLPN